MGYIRYRKGVSDLRHLRHPPHCRTAATIRAIHAILVLASRLEIFRRLPPLYYFPPD